MELLLEVLVEIFWGIVGLAIILSFTTIPNKLETWWHLRKLTQYEKRTSLHGDHDAD